MKLKNQILLPLLLALSGLTLSAEPKKLLVVSTTMGFRHSSIPTAERIIAEIGEKSGLFTVEYARVDNNDPKFKGADGKPDKEKTTEAIRQVLAGKMSRKALESYDGIFFANTTGDLPMPDREALLDFVKSGKGFIGAHSATDTFPGFPGYTEMIGGHFKTHGAQVSVEAIVHDKRCGSCAHLGDRFKVFDEIYILKDYDGSKVKELLTLDKHPNSGEPGDYPIAWKRNYGSGRVFYTSLGHREDVWSTDPRDRPQQSKNAPEVALAYQKHLLGGIKWALKLDGDPAAKPSIKN
jgi:type 1 glutamine amidotransferase